MRYPSPSWTSSGGVRSSTSSTNPGRGMCVCLLLSVLGSVLGSERDLERAERAGRHRVIDRVAPPGERVRRADELLEMRQVSRGLYRGREVVGGCGVGPDELELTEPQRCEVGAGAGDATDDDRAAGPGGSERHVERALGAGALERDVCAAQQEILPSLGGEL